MQRGRDPRRGKNRLLPYCRKQGEATCQRAHTQKARSAAAWRRMRVGSLAGTSAQPIKGASAVTWQFTTRSIKCCIFQDLSKSHVRGDAGCWQQGGQRETHLSPGMSSHAYSSSWRLPSQLQWKGQSCSDMESPRS